MEMSFAVLLDVTFATHTHTRTHTPHTHTTSMLTDGGFLHLGAMHPGSEGTPVHNASSRCVATLIIVVLSPLMGMRLQA